MRGQTKRVVMALLALGPATVAWKAAADFLTMTPQSRLWVDGNSTVRRFSCKAAAFDTKVEAMPDAIPAVLAGEKAVRTVTVVVPAAKLECGNGTMNEHMWKALKTKEHPTIEFRVAQYDVARGAEGVRGTLTGTLTLGGVQRTLSIPAQARNDQGALRVTGSTAVHMKEFGLKPPTLMMGTMKVDETVTVHFDLVLKS